ncbi:hypothetical protein BX616_000052 [Lobosporangium transversale]|uniref:Peptidase M14 domain-containing protein n=1 Tax=Lobosporangium transversale TaxID=64571 RepID=A0A1Y2GIR9_9FUNG|nr:hypothetical protein BCR41DRAFT_387544 [Lobosporangium transversale]KAF9917744.1 hypothetical protein BX616_000052 [Lobosporangium transversale]ORZ12072.1 hypothetical protein BCR41DRAFT_387544 [Lobosporangium transversale]|eukprot:XP_021879937.1 hypothetical protein BCR41DRAFT_387544 [Lobosporangium transversale]
MKVFLNISLVLTLALLTTQATTAQLCQMDMEHSNNDNNTPLISEVNQFPSSAQVVFGGRRHGNPRRIEHYVETFGIKKVSYPRELENHALVRFNARKHHVDFPIPAHYTSLLTANSDPIEIMLDQLDVWSRTRDSDVVLAHFTDKQFQLFEQTMRQKGVPEGKDDWEVVERDLQKLADEDAEKIYMTAVALKLQKINDKKEDKPKKRVDFDTWFNNYHEHTEIKDFYLQLADDYPELISFIPSIGKTVEGKDIFAIKLTAKEKDGSIREKPQIWWQGLQHAREWAGGSTVQYLTYHFSSKYGKDKNITALLHDTEFIIVPVMNIDGYEYTWSRNRLWRKNRRNNGLGSWGVDLNRNWDDHFGEGGSSNFPWSETYRGPHAASEPEVQAMQNFFSQQKRIVGAIDFHCYSQLVLRPEGWTTAPAPHEKEHKFVGDKIASIIKDVHGKKYISEPSVALYKTTGAGSDWFYGEMATKANNGQRVYSYTIELRPSDTNPGGRSGFILPPEEIIPLGEEIAKAMEFFVDYVVKNPLK